MTDTNKTPQFPAFSTLEELQDYASWVMEQYVRDFAGTLARKSLVEDAAAHVAALWLPFDIRRENWEQMVSAHLEALSAANDPALAHYLDRLDDAAPGLQGRFRESVDALPVIDLPVKKAVAAEYFGGFDNLKSFQTFKKIAQGFGLDTRLYVFDEGNGLCTLSYALWTKDGSPILGKILAQEGPSLTLN